MRLHVHTVHMSCTPLFSLSPISGYGEQNSLGIGIWPWPSSWHTGEVQRGWEDKQLPNFRATGHRPQGLVLSAEELRYWQTPSQKLLAPGGEG